MTAPLILLVPAVREELFCRSWPRQHLRRPQAVGLRTPAGWDSGCFLQETSVQLVKISDWCFKPQSLSSEARKSKAKDALKPEPQQLSSETAWATLAPHLQPLRKCRQLHPCMNVLFRDARPSQFTSMLDSQFLIFAVRGSLASMCMYVCMHAWMYVCMDVCMYV